MNTPEYYIDQDILRMTKFVRDSLGQIRLLLREGRVIDADIETGLIERTMSTVVAMLEQKGDVA